MKNGQRRDKTSRKGCMMKIKTKKEVERHTRREQRERDKRQLHNDKTNGFQFYVEKMKHSLTAISRKKKGKNWEMVSSKQPKTKQHTHTHRASMTHPCICICICVRECVHCFMYVIFIACSLWNGVAAVIVVVTVFPPPLFICRIQLINKMRCRRFMCRSK